MGPRDRTGPRLRLFRTQENRTRDRLVPHHRKLLPRARASLSGQKPTHLAEPYYGTVRLLDQDRDRIIRQRYAMVEKARQANNFGIIVSTKPGQSNPTIAINIQHQLEENGKKAVILYADEVVPDKLLDFTGIEVFVDTACPRLALDDPERFLKPIVTRDEIMVVIGAWTWEQLLERGLVRL